MSYNFDIEEIKKQVTEVIKESQNYHDLDLHVDKIIKDWLQAKKTFINKMDGNLIYQTDELITFKLSYESRRQRLHRFADLISVRYSNDYLSEFLYDIKVDDFYDNKTSQNYDAYNSNGELVKVPKNYKVVKCFKFFENNEHFLKDIQNEASRIIQEDCVSGYLCFSVHPLDFLSASENVHNWRSCHALDGEYRSGNLNYLMDSCTVMCYLKAEKQAILPHFPESVPWNSKKWRVWLYFSNDLSMIFAGKQYPFTSNTGLNYIKDNILPTLNFGKWGDFNVSKINHLTDEISGNYFSFTKMVPVGSILKPLTKLMENGKQTYMYNDVLYSTCYDALYAFKKEEHPFMWTGNPTGTTNDKTHFTVGKKCTCPICGENSIDYSEIISCIDCANKYGIGDNEDYYICDICGASVYYDDMYVSDITDTQMCPTCYHHETRRCQCCGTIDLPEVIKYYKGLYLCPDCIEDEDNKTKKELLEDK